MKKKYIFSALALILLILVIVKIINNTGKGKQKAAKATAALVQAECYLARDTVITIPVRAVGYLRANEKVELVSELSARIISINFTEGARVVKGELLFQLDDADRVALLKKNDAELKLAVQTEERNGRLLKSGGTSQQSYDESVSRTKVLEAEGESLKVWIEKAKIRAPFSGKVGIRNVSEGAYVTPGTVLTTVEDLSSIKIDVTVPESQANLLSQGNSLVFRIEGNPNSYHATVLATDPSIRLTTGSLRVLARVAGGGSELLPGTAVSVSLESQSELPAMYIPSQSLIPTPAGYKAYFVEKGKAALRPVVTGLRTEKMVEVTDGVKAGDSILVTGLMKVKPDSKLKIIKTW
jgi:membrane fusion protein (multidrug efflux system)